MQKIFDIEFKKPKNINGCYLSIAHHNNNYVEFVLKNVN